MDEKTTPSNVATVDKTAQATPPARTRQWLPFESLRREIDRLFDDFDRQSLFPRGSFWREPSWSREFLSVTAPAAELVEQEQSYVLSLELPGLDQNNVEVKVANGVLTISGEKKEEKEDKQKRFHVSERRYGAFERSFGIPDDVDADKIEAKFDKGVLTVTLPKSAEARSKEKKIPIQQG